MLHLTFGLTSTSALANEETFNVDDVTFLELRQPLPLKPENGIEAFTSAGANLTGTNVSSTTSLQYLFLVRSASTTNYVWTNTFCCSYFPVNFGCCAVCFDVKLHIIEATIHSS
ncbi:hypothetical protein [Pseudoalteromonas luteoviolacea]|uniref:hypothetical protein n=1 Tax=Pseudoalteromonas luteoviolacea TaxID=43657 RepID=UPI001B360A41|nr:hypothetical protein [Pseudoalteromonas luteoviolacea]MBQ4834775.1 hypothetical protein [Pseudoalteromonas luteoviolacea]